MRLWVRHDERRPDPAPLRTNDALAFVVGLAAWLLGLVIVLGMLLAGQAIDLPWALTAIAVGLALGVAGLLVSRAQGRDRS